MIRIGFTYDLKDDYLAQGFSPEEAAEFDSIETIEGIQNALESLGFQVERIGNLRSLMGKLLEGERWDLVFNIAEGVRGLGRESEIPCLLEAFQITYTFSDPMVLSLCLHKGMTKHVVRDKGIPTSPFCVASSKEELEEKLSELHLEFPLFVKPIGEGTGKGISIQSKVEDLESLRQSVQYLLDRFKQPVLVEEYLPGREYTIGIVGTGTEAKVVGGMEIIYSNKAYGQVYSYKNKTEYESRISYKPIERGIKDRVCELALQSYRALGVRDGGRVDIREDRTGKPQFLEINPLPGLHPVHSDLPILARMEGIPYTKLIESILSAALKRTRL
ncbi:MAG: D-alanine--D-alanine ligase [Spirochaetales bacterium]